eukprot:jgi/Botrbrau1/7576/Bobra.0159s0025.1
MRMQAAAEEWETRTLRLTTRTYRLTIMELALELLCHIFSFLPKPEGLRAVRMVCRAFRAAANGCVSQVEIPGRICVPGADIVLICCPFSAELLCDLHKKLQEQGSLPEKLDTTDPWVVFSLNDVFHGPNFLARATKARISHGTTNRSSFLPYHASLEDTLANMPLLQEVSFDTYSNFPSQPELVLRNVTHIGFDEWRYSDALVSLTRMSSLKSLRLSSYNLSDEELPDSLASLFCTTAFSQLSTLCMPVAMSDVSQLSALTSLTRLIVDLRGTSLSASALRGLTGLRHLEIVARGLYPVDNKASRVTPTGRSFLGALTGLTCFRLTGAPKLMSNLSELGALTALTRLQRLEIPQIPGPPTLREGCPLPLELAVLGTATALQHLQLDVSSAFIAGLTPSAQAALQDALSRLPALTHVALTVRIAILRFTRWHREVPLPDRILPLRLFSGASHLQSLRYGVYPRPLGLSGSSRSLGGKPGEAAPQQGVLSACRMLQRLELQLEPAPSSQVASLLEGITAPHLTKLHLGVGLLTLPLMQAIVRFTTLTHLSVAACYPSRGALLQMPALSQLLELELWGRNARSMFRLPSSEWWEWWIEFETGLLDQINCRRRALCLGPLWDVGGNRLFYSPPTPPPSPPKE